MTEKIEKEIEVKAKQITSNLIAFMKELDTEANKQIKELDLDIEFYKKENAELKLKLEALEGQTPWKDIKDKSEVIGKLTKAKYLLRKFSEFVNNEIEYDPEHPQEHTDLWNKLCEQAEQFLKDSEVEK